MKIFRQPILGLFAWGIWSRFPSALQFFFSRLSVAASELRLSRLFIFPYSLWNYVDSRTYLDQFAPAHCGSRYKSFQDFFTRRLKAPRSMQSDFVWPCDGLLCDVGRVSLLGPVNVKGILLSVSAIFGPEFIINSDSYFANVFLHNSDYHRIHAPTSGEVVKIVRIPGELQFLRPWLYKQPSLPAFTNERINLEIRSTTDGSQSVSWFLSIVGGPGVSTIEMDPRVQIGAQIEVGQELALFRLGSTCCIVAPIPIDNQVGTMVQMGDFLNSKV